MSFSLETPSPLSALTQVLAVVAFALALVLFPQTAKSQENLGINVTPHNQSAEMKWRRQALMSGLSGRRFVPPSRAFSPLRHYRLFVISTARQEEI
jgi:hypothetical protein